MSWFADPERSLRVCLFLLSIGQMISGAQLAAYPQLTTTGGLMDWRVTRLRYAVLATRPTSAFGDLLWTRWGVRPIALARSLAAFYLSFLCFTDRSPLWALFTLGCVDLVLLARMPFAVDGADEMMRIVLWSSFVAVAGGELWQAPWNWFVGLHTIVAYTTAGVTKLKERGWRDGSFVQGILGSRTIGSLGLFRAVRRYPTLAKLAGRVVAGAESAALLVLVLPTKYTFVGLAFYAAFHIGVAAIMGLNLFFWAFVATYPALLYCNYWIHRLAT